MFCYIFEKNANLDTLKAEIISAGILNIAYLNLDDGILNVFFNVELSQNDIQLLTNTINNHQYKNNLPDVTPRQIRQALILSGISLSQIDTAIDSLSEPTKSMARIEWEYSNVFERNRPLVAAVATVMGWTDAQLDALWTLAASL